MACATPRRWLGAQIVDRVCQEKGIALRLTKPSHPGTNGQAERMNQTVKDAAVKGSHDETLDSLEALVLAVVAASRIAQHRKRLRWRTPFQAVRNTWTKDPAPFKLNPHHLGPGPYIETADLDMTSLVELGRSGFPRPPARRRSSDAPKPGSVLQRIGIGTVHSGSFPDATSDDSR